MEKTVKNHQNNLRFIRVSSPKTIGNGSSPLSRDPKVVVSPQIIENWSKEGSTPENRNTRGIPGIHSVFPGSRGIPRVFPQTRGIPRVSKPRVYVYLYTIHGSYRVLRIQWYPDTSYPSFGRHFLNQGEAGKGQMLKLVETYEVWMPVVASEHCTELWCLFLML